MIILGTNSIKAAGGFNVANSCRFNDGSSDSLTRSFSTPTTANKFTLSFWIKRSSLQLGSSTQTIINTQTGNTEEFIRFEENDRLHIFFQNSAGSQTASVKPTYMFRDTSAWYHICIAIDTTQGTDTNRFKFFVNGTRLTDFTTTSYVAQNYTLRLNTAVAHEMWKRNNGDFIDGYIAELVFIDGQQLDADQFGEFDEDSGIWKPIDVSGLTFGNNGFYLDYEDSSALGDDVSGNSNDFTVNNLTAIDQSTDTCTNNFATLNPLDNYIANSIFSEGNLKVVTNSGTYTWNTSTFGVSSGKWYWEILVVGHTGSAAEPLIGIASKPTISTTAHLGSIAGTISYADTGGAYVNGSNPSYGDTYTTNDIIGVALDMDNSKIYFSKNGTFQNSGVPTSGSTGTGALSISASSTGFYFPAIGDYHSVGTSTFSMNFGSPPYSESGGNSDGNGYGNFKTAPPSNYYSLNTKNLSEFG